MKKTILSIGLMLMTPLSWGQTNSYPSNGDVEVKAGKLLIETGSWRSSLLSFRDTHYTPHQIFHFQLESDGLKIKQDESVNYYFKSGGDFIVQNGKIGIGNSAPNEKLHISGNNRIDGSIILNSNGADPYNSISFRHQGDIKWLLDYGTAATNNLRILKYITPASAKTFLNFNFDNELIEIPNVSMGIGTTSTGPHKLAVEGSIGAREIKVEASGWSDFVFGNDYELMPLEEVAQYVTDNKHLPEIPSEAEVIQNGINLGEMNAKLLQKIEELTLYLIEQNRQNKSQQTEIEILKAKLEKNK